MIQSGPPIQCVSPIPSSSMRGGADEQSSELVLCETQARPSFLLDLVGWFELSQAVTCCCGHFLPTWAPWQEATWPESVAAVTGPRWPRWGEEEQELTCRRLFVRTVLSSPFRSLSTQAESKYPQLPPVGPYDKDMWVWSVGPGWGCSTQRAQSASSSWAASSVLRIESRDFHTELHPQPVFCF